MISNLAKIFGTKTKAQEIILLLHDAKEVVRQGFYEKELEEIKEFCEKNNLYLVKSKFKVQLENKNYTNKGIRSREGLSFIYISKDEEKAWLACYYEQINDHQKLGEILGYPECCIDYFLKNFNENNPNPEIKSNNFHTNISKRNEDVVLISHFPCAENCQKSIAMAKNNLNIIAKIDPKRAKELIEKLKITKTEFN